MTLSDVGFLTGLALVDSTSFGTLGVPIFLMLRPRIEPRVMALYLVTIGAFYWAVGLALTLGAGALTSAFSGLGEITALIWVQLAIGVALMAVSFFFDGKRARRRREARAASGAGPSRHERWKNALITGTPRPGVIVTVALGAGLVEVASMLPFLGAVGLITKAGLPAPQVAGVLVGYVLVMTLPALILLALRLTAGRWMQPVLTRLGSWVDRSSDEILGWVLFIVGIVLAGDAGQRLPHG